MKKLLGLALCAAVLSVGCQKKDQSVTEVAEIICKAMSEKDIATMLPYSQCDEADFKAFYEVAGDQPEMTCRNFTVDREFTVVRFSVDVPTTSTNTVPKEGRLTLYKQNGQWKCVELDKARMVRQRREQAKRQQEAAAAAEKAAPAEKVSVETPAAQ